MKLPSWQRVDESAIRLAAYLIGASLVVFAVTFLLSFAKLAYKEVSK